MVCACLLLRPGNPSKGERSYLRPGRVVRQGKGREISRSEISRVFRGGTQHSLELVCEFGLDWVSGEALFRSADLSFARTDCVRGIFMCRRFVCSSCVHSPFPIPPPAFYSVVAFLSVSSLKRGTIACMELARFLSFCMHVRGGGASNILSHPLIL